MELPPQPLMDAPRRRSSDSSSPEFEFWMVGNHPSLPDTNFLTADELFVDGVLLPLHLLSLSLPRPEPNDPSYQPEPHIEQETEPDPPPIEPSASICSTAAAPSSGSKRWKDIFKVGEKKAEEKERKKDRKGSSGGSAELNINIWPFSRSRSAGGRHRSAASSSGRKTSSAPCSRSNSRGESSKPAAAAATRRWAASPGRAGLSGGVHLGRSSPVWQLRRTTKVGEPPKEKAGGGGGRRRGSGGARVLSLNVNTCIGYRNQVSCRDDDGAPADRAGGNGSLFNLRTLFSKKVY